MLANSARRKHRTHNKAVPKQVLKFYLTHHSNVLCLQLRGLGIKLLQLFFTSHLSDDTTE